MDIRKLKIKRNCLIVALVFLCVSIVAVGLSEFDIFAMPNSKVYASITFSANEVFEDSVLNVSEDKFYFTNADGAQNFETSSSDITLSRSSYAEYCYEISCSSDSAVSYCLKKENETNTNCLVICEIGDEEFDFVGDIYGYVAENETVQIKVFVKIENYGNSSSFGCNFNLVVENA